jgi:SAM-dependent methyltransferase
MVGPSWDAAEPLSDDRRFLRATFDEDADAYASSRPVAPGVVFDEVVALAGLGPGSRVLEIGPGTGQATRPLAERGVGVVAVELGAALAARARRDLADVPGVEVVHADVESWTPPRGMRPTFDAVFSCNAFHWLDPASRFDLAAGFLEPGTGHLVVLATPWVVPDGADRFWWDVQDDYEAVGAGRLDPAALHPDRVEDLSPSLRASGRFEEPIVRRHLFAVDYTADGYVRALSTQSDKRAMDPAMRNELLERVRRRIEQGGGMVRAHLLAVLVVARVR